MYWITPAKAKNVVLLTGSLIFYGYGEPHYLILLMVSILVNYFFGLHIGRGGRVQRDRRESGCGNEIDDLEEEEKTPEKRKNRFGRRRRLLFGTAVSANLLMLFYFKLGFDGGTLPVGISFYTFQILSYLIDVYRRDEERENSFIRLATYITMFPQLLSVAHRNLRGSQAGLEKAQFYRSAGTGGNQGIYSGAVPEGTSGRQTEFPLAGGAGDRL